MSVQKPQLAGYLLIGNRSKFIYSEGSTAWLCDSPQFRSRLYETDNGFDRIPIYYQDTVMYTDTKTRRNLNCASPTSCQNNP